MLSSLLYLAMCLLLLFACFLAIPLINRKLKTDLLIWMGKQTGVAWIKVAIAWLAFMLISSTFALADVKMQFSKNMESFGHLAEAQRDFYMSLACFALFILSAAMVECLVDFNHALISKMALERQAKQLSANYETLLEEKLKAEKNIMNARKASSSHSPGPSDENIAENTKLSKRIAQLEHDLENSTRVLNSQKTEIENLQKQKKSLQKQLDDYEFMFGDARKKNQ